LTPEVESTSEEGLATLMNGEMGGLIAEVEEHAGIVLQVRILADRIGEGERSSVDDFGLDSKHRERCHLTVEVLPRDGGEQDVDSTLRRVAAQDWKSMTMV
jgi:hypothetical protein